MLLAHHWMGKIVASACVLDTGQAFWSLSMCEKTDDGRLFFAANPLGRYSIEDRPPVCSAMRTAA